MAREQPRILSDSTKARASSQRADRHDVIGHHHRCCGSFVHGKRMAERRGDPRPHALDVCGF